MRTRDLIEKFVNGKSGLFASNMYSKGDKLFNWETVIAQFIDNILFINTTHYSVTTTKHQNELLRLAERNNMHYYTVDGISMGTNDLSYLYHG